MSLQKPCILGAGPMALHPEVSLAMAAPLVHHMTPYFRKLYAETLERLGRIFKTENYMLMTPCSGTGMVESAITSLFSPGDSVIVTNGGSYGLRFGNTCRAHNIVPIDIPLAAGEPAGADAVLQALRDHPEARAVAVIHVETSTGTISPLEEIARAVKSACPDVLLLVDAVASVGATPLECDAWGLDVVVGASQKALMGAPGLGIASVGELGWKRVAENRAPGFYFNYAFARNEMENNRFPVTPAVATVYALHKALGIIEREGLENTHARCRACRDYLLRELPDLGYRIMARPGFESPTVTTAYVPEGKSALEIMRILLERYNITICTGIGEYLDRAVRIGHMGYVDMDDVRRLVRALKEL